MQYKEGTLEKGRQVILKGFCYHKKHKESYIVFHDGTITYFPWKMFQGSIGNNITKQVEYKKGRKTNIIYTMKHPAVTRLLHIYTHLLYLFTGRNGYQKNQGLDVTL